MQPPIDYFAQDVELPPLDPAVDLLGLIYKRGKYVTLAFKPRTGDAPLQTFTIHQVDARRFVEALSEAVHSEPDLTFTTRFCGGSEGFRHGGPPEKAQLIEYMDPAEREVVL